MAGEPGAGTPGGEPGTRTLDSNTENEPQITTLAAWQYAGIGYASEGDAWLATTAGTRAREKRIIARQEPHSGPARHVEDKEAYNNGES